MKAYKFCGFMATIAIALLSSAYAQSEEGSNEDQELEKLLQQIRASQSTENAASTNSTERAVESVDVGVNVPDEEEVVELVMDGVSGAIMRPSSTGGDDLITVRFEGTLEDAIAMFAEQAEANIIIPQLVENTVISFNLTDVEWRSALQTILDTFNYELYERVTGSEIYSVRLRPEGAPDPLLVKTFVLKYATVPNAARLIRQILSEDDAQISEFASRNMLVVKSSEATLLEIQAILDSIDTVRQQVYIESKFMELTDDAQKDLGIDWSVLRGYSIGTSGDTTKTVENLDTDSRTSTSYQDSEGNVYEMASGYSETQRGGSSAAPWTLSGVTPSVEAITGSENSELLATIMSADQFRVALSAMAENKGVNIVSNPKIIVANEEPANISIIRKEPNLVQDRKQASNDTADTITFRLDDDEPFFEYGIKLDVTPSINTSSNITVQINPSLTRKFADKPAGQNTYPIIDEKSIETVFNLASGQTAAIGGLTEVTESQITRKVPLLGSIPLLGRLFSWEQTVHGQNETIIFVTVGLANTQELDAEIGMPTDSELARLQVIRDRNSKQLRELNREYYSAEEADKLDDLLKDLERQEQERIQNRDLKLLEAEEEEAIRNAERTLDSAD